MKQLKLPQVKICTSEEFLFYFERKYIIDKYDITIYEWVFWIIYLLFLLYLYLYVYYVPLLYMLLHIN